MFLEELFGEKTKVGLQKLVYIRNRLLNGFSWNFCYLSVEFGSIMKDED